MRLSRGRRALQSLFTGVVFCCAFAGTPPQAPKESTATPQSQITRSPEFKVDVRLIQIEVRVRMNGQPVTDLTLADFSLKEEGTKQEISRLEYVPARSPRRADGSLEELKKPVAGESEAHSAGALASPPGSDRTWIYLAPEVDNPREFSRTAIAIERFLQEQLAPGFLVSLGGLPFTDNQELLVEALRRMTAGPYGAGKGHPPGINPESFHLSEVEFQRQVALTLAEQSSGLISISRTEREPNFAGSLSDVPVMSVEAVDRQVAFFGHLALFRYLDLIERLADYPGKKVVVLFRSGLRLDMDNFSDMQQLAAAAQKHRISFYTIDSRGLDAPLPVIDRAFALPFESGRRAPVPNLLGDYQRLAESMDGLVVLARQTDGRAVTDTNNMGEVIDAVVEDAADYYLLGYYPKLQQENGRFRRIQVEVKRPGLVVEAPKGYFEKKPFDVQSDKERSRSLRHALLETESGELNVKAKLELFADEDGRPFLFFSVGVHVSELLPKTHRAQQVLSASVLARITDDLGHKLPLYHEHSLEHRIPRNRWQNVLQDESAYLTYNARLPASPGRYLWKVALQDENSGKIGVNKAQFSVPDFRGASTPSSLLVTHQVLRDSISTPGKNGGSSEGSRSLQAGGLLYTPQPSGVFPQGAAVYLLYDLYNPTPEDSQIAADGMQLALLRDERPVESVQASGQPFVDAKGRVIRYTAVISTSNLEPGEYRVLGILPNYQTRRIPHLEERFTLVRVD